MTRSRIIFRHAHDAAPVRRIEPHRHHGRHGDCGCAGDHRWPPELSKLVQQSKNRSWPTAEVGFPTVNDRNRGEAAHRLLRAYDRKRSFCDGRQSSDHPGICSRCAKKSPMTLPTTNLVLRTQCEARRTNSSNLASRGEGLVRNTAYFVRRRQQRHRVDSARAPRPPTGLVPSTTATRQELRMKS